MIQRNRITTLAFAGALAFGLSACGGDDEPEATAPAQTESDAAGDGAEESADAGSGDMAQETEGDDMAEETAEETEAPVADGDVPPLEDIWSDVIENANSAESMTATISGSDGTMAIDATLTGQLDDSNFQVDATIDDGEVSIIADGETYYINGDEGFWGMAGAPDAGSFAGQWIEAPAEMGIGDTFSLSSLWSDFFAEVPQDGSDLQTSTAELSDLDGVEAYHYVIDGQDAEVWVSADGEQNLLRVLIGEGQEQDIELTVTDWNETEPVEPPEDAVPAEELMGG